MPYVKMKDRTQETICSLDLMVKPESTARLIDAFVESLEIGEYGVKEVADEGRPQYSPKSLFKMKIPD